MIQWDGRPMAAEDFTAKRLGFALKDDAEAGLLKSEVQAADSGEKRGDFV
jgi:hypothetical protein